MLSRRSAGAARSAGRLLAVWALLSASGCGGGPAAPDAGASPPDLVRREPAEVYGALPDCEPPPEAAAHDPVKGLVLPEGAVITQVLPQPPLTQVNGYVARTPIEVAADLAERDGITVLMNEDEILEAEVLVSHAGHRTFVRARSLCRTGSLLGVVVVPEHAEDALPEFGGQEG